MTDSLWDHQQQLALKAYMDLYQYLQSANSSLFRFESLQEYKVEDDGIDDEGMKEWWNFISLKTKNGVLMERVRLVTEPLTEYTKNELVVRRKSKTFGDNIRIIKEETFNTLNIEQKDFWLIDEKVVLKMNHSINGEYSGFSVMENDIDSYIETKNILLKSSVNL